MTIVRDGKRMSVPVTVQEMPSRYTSLAREESEEGNNENNANPNGPMSFEELGIEVKELTPQLAEKMGLKDAKGVVVGTVKPGSPAAEAGLSEGMVVESVNKHPFATPEQFQEAMKHVSLKNGLIFQIRTARGTTLLAIRKG
jgi:serine protease Do